jgi:serine O-acetyltransferase
MTWDWKADLRANSTRRGTVGAVTAYFLDPGFAAVGWLRFARASRKKGRVGKICSKLAFLHMVRRFSCYISPLAEIGSGIRLPHPVGIVIGEECRIGNDVTIYQHVTLGRRVREDVNGYPAIEDSVTIYAGAVIIGSIRIGTRSVIGANAVVNGDVPPGSTVVGIPGRAIGKS